MTLSLIFRVVREREKKKALLVVSLFSFLIRFFLSAYSESSHETAFDRDEEQAIAGVACRAR